MPTADINHASTGAATRAATPPIMRNALPAQFGYVHGLDGLRLFAVLIVIIRHYEIVMQLPGGFGVSVFFFISGFLITRLLLAEEKKLGHIRLGAFFIRRFIRLLPPLMLMGAVAVPTLYAIDPAAFSPLQIVLSFLYLGNIVKSGAILFGWKEGYIAIEPLWSLAVEEHFYLLLPPALLILRSLRSRLWLIAAAIVVPPLLRLAAYVSLPTDLADQINYHFTFTRLDSMAWGVALTLLLEAGVLRRQFIDRHAHLLVWGGGALMIASMVHYAPVYELAIKYTPQSAAIGAFFTGIVFAERYGWLRAMLEWRPVVHLGRISYELYLWHFPVLAVVAWLLPGRWAIPLALILSVVVAEIAFALTTKRLAGLRRRFGGHPVS